MTCARSTEQASLFDQTSFAAAFPAKTCRWLEGVLDLLETAADCGSSSTASFRLFVPAGFLSKTSLDCFPLEPVATSESWSKRWRTAGMAWGGESLTLSFSEFPNGAAACSLSDILETSDVPPKYFLSPTACRGILRRAANRGRVLPPALQAALQQAAESTDPDDDGKTTLISPCVSMPKRAKGTMAKAKRSSATP